MEQDKSTKSQASQAGRTAGSDPAPQRGSPVSANLEIDYWRTNYQHRPYVEPGATYEQYAPAYRYGAEMCSIHSPQGRSFDEVEPDLSRSWEQHRGKSRLSWEKARAAARDAWGRVANVRPRPVSDDEPVSPPSMDNAKVVGILRKLHHIAVDGAKGFREAADKVNPEFTDLLLRTADEREAIDHDLRDQIALRGVNTEETGDTMGALHRGWIGLKSAIAGSDKAIIDECERGEEAAVRAYQEALNEQGLPADIEILLNRHYARVKNSHDQITQIKHALDKT
jgi:uncharacterized protein (TIGR02284 family)